MDGRQPSRTETVVGAVRLGCRDASLSPRRTATSTHLEGEVVAAALALTRSAAFAQHRSVLLARRPGGSIYAVGRDFQPFRFDDLDLVDLTGIEPVTS